MMTAAPLPRSAPEAQGLSSAAVLAFVAAVERANLELHSLMLLRHGQVVAEGWWSPYGPEHPHMLFSLSKSFTSTAIGLAVAEGRLSVDDPVLSFFPDEAPPEVGPNLAAMRVRHLLTMSTGHAEDTTEHLRQGQDDNWARAFLLRPVEHEPGTHFLYNSGATYMLSAIVQRLTGQTVLQYLQPRLFAPLGIESPTWETCPRGINAGGWGLSIRTEDIARFGQLYLQQGLWQGKRLVPEAWVEAATARQVANSSENSDWAQGYGYQFWHCRHGAYRGDGAFGQFCLVMPGQDAVLAITGGFDNMQAALDRVWEHLLPAFRPQALPEDRPAQEELARKLASLALPAVQGRPSSPLAAGVSGRAYTFGENKAKIEAISFDLAGDGCILTVRDDRGEHRVSCGAGAWRRGTTTLPPVPLAVAATGAWTAPDTYTFKLCYYEAPFSITVSCRFAEDRLLYQATQNVAFGPLELPQLEGRSA